MRRILARLAGAAIALFARLITAVRVIWAGVEPTGRQRVYFANHRSNADTVLIWTALPPQLRARTRPVAAADYWLTSPIRRFIGSDVFNAVLIDRRKEHRTEDPVEQMIKVLDEGSSLILFPEGTRNTTAADLLPFKSGLYHLAARRPDIDLVPTWTANLNHVMPKGEIIPVPLICTVSFGSPIRLGPSEEKGAFLERARVVLLALKDAEAAS